MSSHILFRNENLNIEHFYTLGANRRGVVFVFTPSLNRDLEGNKYGGEVFFRNGFDVIAFKNSRDDWFQNVPINVFSQINSLCISFGYKKRLAYGSSMGAFASISFSKILNLDSALLLSPQFSICEDFDTRWKSYCGDIDFIYNIDQYSINNDCFFHILFDSKDLDSLHVQKIVSLIRPGKFNLHSVAHSGHPVTHYLSEVSIIKDLIINFVDLNDFSDINFLVNRRSSKSFMYSMSLYLMNRRKFKSALWMVDSAIRIDGSKAAYYYTKCLIEQGLNQYDNALLSINKAISIDNSNLSFLRQRDIILNSFSND